MDLCVMRSSVAHPVRSDVCSTRCFAASVHRRAPVNEQRYRRNVRVEQQRLSRTKPGISLAVVVCVFWGRRKRSFQKHNQGQLLHVIRRATHECAELVSQCFRIAAIANKGNGVVASRDITCGELIVCERPLLTYRREDDDWLASVQQQYAAIPPDAQEEIMAMHDCTASAETKTLRGIVSTNCFECGDSDGTRVVCKTLCRFNHSCVPNCEQTWDEEASLEQIRASRDIQKGEELCIYYVNVRAPRAQRARAMQSSYKFECDCRACADSNGESDWNRARLEQLAFDINEALENRSADASHGVRMVSDILALLNQEHLILMTYRQRVCYYGFLFCLKERDLQAAVRWLQEAYRCAVVAHGREHLSTRQLQEQMREVQGFLAMEKS